MGLNALIQEFIALIASLLAVVFVLTLHEYAHALVATLCGDPTPKWNKRLSMNPFRHFDLIGLISFTLVGFGWAKPVPINPNNFKKYRLGLGLTASAGIIVNLLTALIIYPIYCVCYFYFPVSLATIRLFLCDFTFNIFVYSLCFAIFNLLPLFPLDGFRIVDALDRKRGGVYRFLRDYGQWILLGLIAESFLCSLFVRLEVPIMHYFDILGWLSYVAVNYIGFPIQALWGLIPW